MFYTIYKITNSINGKIYIGCHKTENIDDDYMGSGKYLKRAQEKYGIENFEKEILEVFDNPEQMFEMESKLVNSEFVERYDTYNLKEGGNGGFEHLLDSYIGSDKHLKHLNSISSKGGKKRASLLKEQLETDIEFKKNYCLTIKNTLNHYYENGGCGAFKNKKHSETSKKKIGEANSKHQSGEGNSQFGTMWIHSLTEKVSKKISKDEFSEWEAKGWLKGRKIKFF